MHCKTLIIFVCLALLSLRGNAVEKPLKRKSFKILSYNILEGLKDAEKKSLFVKLVDSLKADVVTLQECNHFTDVTFLKFAKELSYPYALLLKEKGYPTGIMSKYPIENGQKITEGFLHGFLAAKINGYHFVNLHLNPFMYERRNEEIKLVLGHLDKLPSEAKVIMMGDFNSLSPQDSAVYKQNRQKLAKLIAHDKSRPHIKNVNNGNFDYSVIGQLLSREFIDTWKLRNGNNYEKSAPSPVLKPDPLNDVRIDYIWVSPNLSRRIQQAFMIKNEATDKISDHYPQVLVLNK